MVMASSPAMPAVRVSSCKSSTLAVFFTLSQTVSRSSGSRVRRSITFDLDAFRGERFGGLERYPHHGAISDDAEGRGLGAPRGLCR